MAFVKFCLIQGHDSGDLLARGFVRHKLPQMRPVRPRQQTDDDLLLDQESEAGKKERIIEQIDQAA